MECRIGNAVYPAHYDVGWHITGTSGVFGAAAARASFWVSTEQQMVWALGMAATQPVGLREMFGTMTKSFIPGRAAQNGLTAALLAQQTSPVPMQAIEAQRGGRTCLSTTHNYAEITRRARRDFEISSTATSPSRAAS